MKKIAKMFMLLLIAVTIFVLSSCGGNPEPYDEVTIALSRASLDMTVGDEYILEAIISPATHKNDTIEWSSSDESIASCEGGVVTAKAVGTANITASIRRDVYFICRVDIIEDIDNIYMLTGEVIPFKETSLSSLDLSAKYISTDESIVRVINGEEGPSLEAVGSGRAIIKLVGEKSDIACFEIVVLDESDYGVTVNIDECPKSCEYNMISYSTRVDVLGVDIEKSATREQLASGCVEVHIIFRYKKSYDSDGNLATNPTQFRYEIYSGEKEGVLRSYAVLVSDECVEDGDILEYTYKFEAVLDDGDGERSFTFKILDSNG